ncbi:hypothetical protein B566_EDAN009094 [Ephemera danica]|nr:hypothetical protein B566_EDAN009094 [Ephemera danica]
MFGFLESLLPGWPFTLSMLFAVFGLIYVYFTINFNHWRDKGIKFIKPYPFVGSIGPLMSLREHILEFNQRLYREYQGEPYVGYFQGRTPTLMVFDKNIVKNIFVKDFAHFTDHGFRINEEADPLEAKNLFNMEGQKWKEMRAKLTPTFTSGRMKAMFPLVLECAENFEQYLTELATTGEEFESKDLLSRYTTDVIGSCAFGIQCNSIKDPNCEFRVMGKKTMEIGFWRAIKTMVMFFLPEIGMKLRLAFFDKELSDFFRNLVRDVIALRSKTGNTRKDFMQLLIEIKEKGRLSSEDGSDNHDDSTNTKIEWTNDDVVAQALVFFVAGFETSSTLMSFALLELAIHPEVQETLQKEIDEVLQRYDGKPSYQSLQEMHYLDKVIQGNRFALMQSKMGLIAMMRNFSVQKSNRTQYPVKLDPKQFILTTKDVGSIGPILSTREHAINFNVRLYRKYEGEPYIGLYQGRNPSLMLLDPEIVKHVLVKDFNHFTDHGIRVHEEADPLEAKNLFNLEGQKWKEMRAKLTPTFTSGRMKAMFPLVLECAEQFEQHLAGLASTGVEFEAKDLLSRYTTDAIGSCAFGIQCNSIKDPN